jgi:carbamoyl-phosphate synthase small subunit
MMGTITHDESPEEALARLREMPRYEDVDYVRWVSTQKPYEWPHSDADAVRRIVVLDLGLKYNILRILTRLGCRCTAVPCGASAEEILSMQPDGVLLSPGPGDPALLNYTVETARGLIGRTPLMGICLGHQVLAQAFGATTFKLKFGHRGANHPVRDLMTGQVYITAQNHGYAVDPGKLPPAVEVSHVNLNDDTVEGLRHRELPILTIQYHSEASTGPLDNMYMFERFLGMMG